METMIGRCEYCGAEQTVIADDQADADRQVAEACDCGAADIEAKKHMLRTTLSELAGELAPDNGFKAVSPETFELITDIGDAVVEGRFDKASIKVDGTNISITRSGNKVAAFRSETRKRGGNIE